MVWLVDAGVVVSGWEEEDTRVVTEVFDFRMEEGWGEIILSFKGLLEVGKAVMEKEEEGDADVDDDAGIVDELDELLC